MNNCAGVHKRSQWQYKSNCLMEVDQTYQKEEFLCHTKKGFALETPWTIWKRKTKKVPQENRSGN